MSIFKSLGLGVQDMVAAQMIHESLPKDYACEIPVPYWSDPEVKVALDVISKKSQVGRYISVLNTLKHFNGLQID